MHTPMHHMDTWKLPVGWKVSTNYGSQRNLVKQGNVKLSIHSLWQWHNLIFQPQLPAVSDLVNKVTVVHGELKGVHGNLLSFGPFSVPSNDFKPWANKVQPPSHHSQWKDPRLCSTSSLRVNVVCQLPQVLPSLTPAVSSLSISHLLLNRLCSNVVLSVP
jgi:hypothetical protein